jgi:hypothetical protein
MTAFPRGPVSTIDQSDNRWSPRWLGFLLSYGLGAWLLIGILSLLIMLNGRLQLLAR